MSVLAGGGGHAAMPKSLFQFLVYLMGFVEKLAVIFKLWPNINGGSVQTRRDAAGSSICLSATSQLINEENSFSKNYGKLNQPHSFSLRHYRFVGPLLSCSPAPIGTVFPTHDRAPLLWRAAWRAFVLRLCWRAAGRRGPALCFWR